MDRDVAARLERLVGSGIRDMRSMGGQHGAVHYRVDLADGRTAFAKVAHERGGGGDGGAGRCGEGAGRRGGSAGRGGPGGQDEVGFAAEASGLRWLGAAGGVAVPEVLGWDEAILAIDWIPQGAADGLAALRFGRELAALHAAGADGFGAPWPGVIAGLPLPNETPPNETRPTEAGPPGSAWPEWYARSRLLPYVRLARNAGTLTANDVQLIESAAGRAGAVAGPAEPPSRIHGDCWAGNVLWSGGRGWLVDPAAHGGHRETDLAMLALFGAPYLDQIMAGYQEVSPLADGWRARVPLHQLHPLLVHACLFGTAYAAPTLAAARAILAL